MLRTKRKMTAGSLVELKPVCRKLEVRVCVCVCVFVRACVCVCLCV